MTLTKQADLSRALVYIYRDTFSETENAVVSELEKMPAAEDSSHVRRLRKAASDRAELYAKMIKKYSKTEGGVSDSFSCAILTLALADITVNMEDTVETILGDVRDLYALLTAGRTDPEVLAVLDFFRFSVTGEQAFLYVFQKNFRELEIGDIAFQSVLSGITKGSDASVKIAETVFANLEEIDGVITRFSKGWSVNRLSKPTLAILRTALCILMYYDDAVKFGFVVNEAVDIAKKYCGEKEPGFINGILGSYIRSL